MTNHDSVWQTDLSRDKHICAFQPIRQFYSILIMMRDTHSHTVTAVKKWQLFIISRHFYHCTVRSHLTLGHNDCCPQFFVHLYCFLIQMFTLIKSLFNILLLCKFFHHKYNMHDLIPFLYPPNTCQKLYISSILVVLNYNRTQNCKQL